mmetsp:Transcript_10428/g.16009  ORF Transcript_10428/g.16009 Transcript_10428/m.16009 type:complete len:168 (+) Transcript_10428:70-573(+)
MVSLPTPDLSCSQNSDCAVKNVGNCCGYFPECVNQNYCADYDRVQDWCRDNSMASICGFPEIHACICNQDTGTCEGVQCVGEACTTSTTATALKASDVFPSWPAKVKVISNGLPQESCHDQNQAILSDQGSSIKGLSFSAAVPLARLNAILPLAVMIIIFFINRIKH